MQTYEEIKTQAGEILRTLCADGLNLSVTDNSKLHIVGTAKPAQLQLIRLWKRHIIEALSPKCSNCTLSLQLINDGELWFCPFGCQSLEVEN